MLSIDKIKQQVSGLGISQSELARLSGLSFGTINRIFNGKQDLKPNTLAKIAKGLNLSISQLMGDEAEEIIETEVQGYIEYDGEINFTDGEVTNLKWFDLDDLPENIFHLNKPVLNNIKKYLETKKVIVD